ncbi:MAG: hypothetical protein JXB49_31935 [Bacteroidales bacterium]|nr:hypothetical protein [Bacteroidales bacterium]
MSWRIHGNWHIHLSAGATYADSVSFSNTDSVNYNDNSFNNTISSVISACIDYNITSWITLNSTASYGSTFLYADNIRKQKIVVPTRVAPFIKSK